MSDQRIPFQLRGHKISRIDAFSDVVFGFALTLLVVSLEVPHTFGELMDSLHGFLPFSICFFLLMQIWYMHYKFSVAMALKTSSPSVSIADSYSLSCCLFIR